MVRTAASMSAAVRSGMFGFCDFFSLRAGQRTGAFAELLSRHYDHLWHVARRTSYTVEDAADALQDALLSAHRTAGSFREDAAVRSWLHTIVVNASGPDPAEPCPSDGVAVRRRDRRSSRRA